MSSLAHGEVLAWLYLPTPPQSPHPSLTSTVPCTPSSYIVCDCCGWITPYPLDLPSL